MDSIISELYYGNICPVEQLGRLAPEVKDILKRLHENEDKLEGSLNEQEKTCCKPFRMTGLRLLVSFRKSASAKPSRWGQD